MRIKQNMTGWRDNVLKSLLLIPSPKFLKIRTKQIEAEAKNTTWQHTILRKYPQINCFTQVIYCDVMPPGNKNKLKIEFSREDGSRAYFYLFYTYSAQWDALYIYNSWGENYFRDNPFQNQQ